MQQIYADSVGPVGGLSKPPHTDQAENPTVENQNITYVQTNLLTPMPNQPRQVFMDESLQELAKSIQTYGILQPLIVFEGPNNNFLIVAGERRWRAAKLAGITKIPCIVRKSTAHPKMELALIENIQREDLSAVDEALTYQKLMQEQEYTQDRLSEKIGKDRTTVTNAIRLLSLPKEILDDIQHKRLSAGHGKAICALEDKKAQLQVHQLILLKKLSVRQTEDLVRKLKKGKQETPPLTDNLPPNLRFLCDQFKGHLGTKVRISGGNDRGKIEISYYTPDDLERITELVLGNPLSVSL